MKRKNLIVARKTHNFYLTKLRKPFIKKAYEVFSKNLEILNLKNKKIIVAVSGGADSLSLLFLSKCYSLKKKVNLHTVIVDHKIREGSTAEAKKLKNLLKNKFQINCKILSKDKNYIFKNVQSKARELRYELLAKECKKEKISHILLGHNKDDVIENFFIRLLRGSGLKGLISIDNIITDYNGIKIIRPLLFFSKKDLLELNKKTYDYFIEDPSNFNDKFLRSRVRKILKNLEEEGLNFNKFKLTLQNLSKSEKVVDYYVKQNISENVKFFKGKQRIILNKDFFDNPDEIVFHSFTKVIHHLGYKKHYARGKKIINLLKSLNSLNKRDKFTLSGCIIEKVSDSVVIYKEKR